MDTGSEVNQTDPLVLALSGLLGHQVI